MRILVVAFGIPSKRFGGGIGTIQSLRSISGIGEVDYIGPKFDTKEIQDIQFSNKYYLDYDNNIVRVGLLYLLGLPFRFYSSWRIIQKRLINNSYDIVFTDFSRYDFVTKWAHKHGAKSIVRVHNIETDYVARAATKKSFARRMVSFPNRVSTRLREKKCLAKCDAAVFLSQKDVDRAHELFSDITIRSCNIVPICVDEPKALTTYNELQLPDKYILATGSLWYGSNSEGIIWFLDNVWAGISDKLCEYSLVIAGGNPNEKLKEKCCLSERCILYENPTDMYPFFKQCSVYIAPVFDGAGMKVKIAEAYSYGLPIVGTSHAFIGYILPSNGAAIADDKDTFATHLIALCKEAETLDRNVILDIFKKEYSMTASKSLFSQLFNELLAK